jgi:hypothetical protein
MLDETTYTFRITASGVAGPARSRSRSRSEPSLRTILSGWISSSLPCGCSAPARMGLALMSCIVPQVSLRKELGSCCELSTVGDAGVEPAPPPCKGEDGRCRVLQPLAELPYLSRFLFSALPCVAQYCVPGGVGVVSTGGGSVGLASLVPVHLQDDPALALVYFFPFGGCRPCEPRATVSVDHRGTHAG